MFTRESFEGPLHNHVTELQKNSPDGGVTVAIRLRTGEHHSVWSVADAADGYVALDVYDEGKRMMQNSEESVAAGAPRYAFDRLIVPYDEIVEVRITARAPAGSIGFKR